MRKNFILGIFLGKKKIQIALLEGNPLFFPATSRPAKVVVVWPGGTCPQHFTRITISLPEILHILFQDTQNHSQRV